MRVKFISYFLIGYFFSISLMSCESIHGYQGEIPKELTREEVNYMAMSIKDQVKENFKLTVVTYYTETQPKGEKEVIKVKNLDTGEIEQVEQEKNWLINTMYYGVQLLYSGSNCERLSIYNFVKKKDLWILNEVSEKFSSHNCSKN